MRAIAAILIAAFIVTAAEAWWLSRRAGEEIVTLDELMSHPWDDEADLDGWGWLW